MKKRPETIKERKLALLEHLMKRNIKVYDRICDNMSKACATRDDDYMLAQLCDEYNNLLNEYIQMGGDAEAFEDSLLKR